MTTTEFRHAQMVGSDKRMDERGNFNVPVNPLPVKCQTCTFSDLDHVPQPYFLAKGTKDPNEMALAEVGNFFVRERTRKILETVAPNACRFYPTHDLKTKEPTPWSLAVPVTLIRTAIVKQTVPRCPECGEPKVAHPGSHYDFPPEPTLGQRAAYMAESAAQVAGPVAEEVFKSLNWTSGERIGEESGWYFMHILGWKTKQPTPPFQWTRVILGRELYFSIRLVTLLQSLGIKGLNRYEPYNEKPSPDELAWVAEKRQILVENGLLGPPVAKKSSDLWFRMFLQKRAAKPVEYDWNKIETDLGVPLPDSYKRFVSTVGDMTFQDVDEQEGFTVHVLPPTGLDQSLRKGYVEILDEENEVDGLTFASTDHGDCLCFDLAQGAPNYPVYLYDHEMNVFEAYANDFMECIQRLAGE